MKRLDCEQDTEIISRLIYNSLSSNSPVMIARFGANELLCLVSYLGIKENNRNLIDYLIGKSNGWWWNERNLKNLNNGAGFFPNKIEYVERFCELLYDDIKELDILGSWLIQENYLINELKDVQRVRLLFLEPFWSIDPWTRILQGKNVLVVHPFSKTIENQYKRRELLFENKDVLPEFNLITLKAVQSIAGEKTNFENWFDALEFMKSEIDKVDYDICLIGAGAYGFSLAAHVKRKGKKSVHLGGSLQLLFGIKGKRWENYDKLDYVGLMNDFWVYPSEEERPKKASNVENACYW